MLRCNKVFYIILFAILWQLGSSQVSVVLPLIKPGGNYGYVFKPGLGLELRYSDRDFDEKLQYGFTLGIFGAKPRKEVFHEYIVESHIYSSDASYSHFYSIMIGIYTEYKFIDGDFSPFAGIDTDVNGTHYREGDPVNYSTNGSLFIGLLPKIGVFYKLSDQFILMGGFGKYMSIDKGFATLTYWKTFVGINYYFN